MHTPRLTVSMIGRLLAAAFVGILLASCGPPGGLPTCDPSELMAPESLSPGGSASTEGEIVDSLTPTLSWTYPGTSCLPDSYVITLATSWSGLSSAREIGILIGTEYTPDDPLLPGTTHIWRVAAVAAGGERAWRHNGIFRTGPVCDEAWSRSLEVPIHMSPTNGEHLDTLNPTLEWDDPTPCLPNGHYNVEIDTTPRFEDPLIGQYPEPYLWVDEPWVTFELEACTTYYWRVEFDLRDYPDQPTPYSHTWSFTTGSEAGTICPVTIPVVTPIIPVPGVGIPLTGHAAIAGHVWHDECATPSESTDVAPPGCVIMPDGGIEANGELDAGESGIEGVTVRLSTGPCPGEPGWTSMTDVSGQYGFYDLLAGTYCLEINTDADGNEDVLPPGNWTVPERWYGPGPISVEVTLGSDDDISRMNDFAWDFQFLPAPAAATPAPSPMVRARQTANCRFGPSTQFDPSAILDPGDLLPILGRNADSTWWLVRPPGEPVDCWVWGNAVETIGDLSSVPAQIGPPTPTPAGCWVRACSQCPNQCVYPCPPEIQQPAWCTP